MCSDLLSKYEREALANGTTLLHEAMKSHHLDMVENLLKKGANPNEPNKDGLFPLLTALFVYQDWPAVFDLFLEYGANVNQQGRAGLTPLMASVGHPVACQTLLEKGAHVNMQDAYGFCALSQIFISGVAPPEALLSYQSLKAHGADMHLLDHQGRSILTIALNTTYKRDYSPILDDLVLQSKEKLSCSIPSATGPFPVKPRL